jgi:hypothetical protein
VTDQPSSPDDRGPGDFGIDTHVTRPARLHNYLAGGDGNFAVDREAAEKIAASLPDGVDTIRAAVESLGNFTERTVRYLVEEGGIRQLLYVGTPVPAGREVHDIAQHIAPDARVVYVGNDPVVLAHAHRLRRGTPEGATTYVQGTLRAPEKIWEQAGKTLDLSRPVGVMLPETLCLVRDEADPYEMVARLLEAVPSGSYLVVAHPTTDFATESFATPNERLGELLPQPYVARTHAEVARFLEGLDLVEPGLVPIDDWRPPADAPSPRMVMPMYVAVGQKT